ncbi:RNA 2',3'-cyclic phosphodiesterase [Oceanobacillus arenosus]|uniref:RNA 2',3'-cyclic phosphodiesterase n=1 Tax=Oceanobacillus arenosus TaxID=1229153 RepID=A0A3D8PRW7_9BACI|nr:RNA 2',3'-cyclic phosphodiesterase [Oceanobacillus arenosus]RDW18317.1 RNA 2',3'-cyclic phosphodiesterase [Oceanobacillus arenosus]
MSDLAHYFIAIHLSRPLQDHFADWQTELKERLAYKQWTAKQDLHITLKFLGPIDDNKLRSLKYELAKNLTSLANFPVLLGSIGVFGNPNKPRVLFAGVETTKALLTLQQIVETSSANVGFIKETRAFHPHITLAKKWAGNDDIQFEGMIGKLKYDYQELKSMLVADVVLFQIYPKRNPKYVVIDRYELQSNNE